MKEYLVGYTGFVGSNLAYEHEFNGLYNSKNIADAFGGHPDLLVYAGLPAEMFLANQAPEKDYQRIEQAMANIEAIHAKTVVLISTVAVYPDTRGADENTVIDETRLPAYGANRLALERWVEQNCPRHLIVRLPAIYGKNLKKNFIYDLIHVIPALLTEKKLAELSNQVPQLREYYINQNNGFYKCRPLDSAGESQLKAWFQKLEFSALNFTDSRSRYQFYSLGRLWKDIQTALVNGLQRINLVTPPISAAELHQELTGKPFVNELDKPPYDYDLRTKFSDYYMSSNGYIINKKQELDNVFQYVKSVTIK